MIKMIDYFSNIIINLLFIFCAIQILDFIIIQVRAGTDTCMPCENWCIIFFIIIVGIIMKMTDYYSNIIYLLLFILDFILQVRAGTDTCMPCGS